MKPSDDLTSLVRTKGGRHERWNALLADAGGLTVEEAFLRTVSAATIRRDFDRLAQSLCPVFTALALRRSVGRLDP
ncbi:DeoR family transcriptional regulator [Actinomadura bangladeshensis]|uniref:DeoR family transcriptional regulator n=1 Tax=Actinomadura bangladeshensis TaxID=453573 RepID=A0A4R4NRK5_9ACTN|nr:DeoR family transcriptional regulator [Actinomadura bangladeshensis]TDC12005.1 DeoR family transcriptional regulator [Actinomadura bangladeshensis]